MLEDSPTDAELIQRFLQKEYADSRFKLAVTRDGFLKALEEFEPDLILADNSLPQFDATEALRIVRERGSQIPFIMVSGTTKEEYAVQIIKSGADDYILKESLTRLPAAIDSALRHRETEQEKQLVLQALEQSEEKYRTIVDRISDGFMILDKQWQVIYANLKADDIFGKPRGFLEGKKLNLEFPQAVGRPFFNAYTEALETKKQVNVEEYSVVAEHWIRAVLYPSEKGVAVFFHDITDQRKAELEVRKSEERYIAVISRISEGFIVLDDEWKILFVNPTTEQFFNRRADLLIGKNIKDDFPKVIQGTPFFGTYQQAVLSGENQYLDAYSELLGRWVQANYYPSPEGVAIFFRDVTNQKIAEEQKRITQLELRRSEDNYKDLVERISDGFMVIDRRWVVTYINSTAEKLLLRQPGYLLGKKMKDEFPGALDRPFLVAFDEALRTGQNKYIEEYFIPTNRWFQASIYPSVDGVAVFFRDITEQRKAEEEVRKSEEKYRVFIQRITDAFISLDRNWCYTYLNKQAGEMINRKPEELIGKKVWAVFPDAVHTGTFKAFSLAMEEQRYVTNVDYYAPLDLWQENHIYPSPDGISVFIRNISEKKKLELELSDQQKKEQQKMIAVAIEAQEKERNAIAGELHDNLNQILVGTRVMLSVLKDSPGKLDQVLDTCMNNLGMAILENRKIAHELITPDLATENLLEQLGRLCDTMLRPAGIDPFIQKSDFSEDKLTSQQKLAVYRIAQEQCTNIVKYARAKSVIFALSTPESQFVLRITDDGVGAVPGKTNDGIGLQNIRNRVAVFGGTVQINTKSGEGFELEINMPAG